jgi:hypothetical protein
MNLKIEITPDQEDLIVKESLRWHEQNNKTNLARLDRHHKTLQAYEIEDRIHCQKLADAFKIINEYFGVHNEQ